MKKIFLITFITITFFGCQSVSHDNTLKTSSGSQKISVVTSFYPLAFLTKNIVGEKGTVHNLAGNRDVHEYRPSPQDVVKIHNADLIVIQGSQLEPWSENVLSELKQKRKNILEVSHNISLIKMKNHEEQKDEELSHHHDEDKKQEGDSHNHGEFDPHTWLDPVLAQQMVDVITQSLQEIDHPNRDYYQQKAEKLKQKFQTLDKAYQSELNSCERDEVITTHDAFGYIAKRYGFKTHAIAGVSTHDEPSANTLVTLKKEAQEGLTHILIEQNKVTRFAETLSEETGLKMLPINPLGRGTLDPEKNFFEVMDDNLQILKTALGCQ